MFPGSAAPVRRFTRSPDRTANRSPALAHAAFFVPVACMVARQLLELPYDRFPLTRAEDAAVAAIPALFATQYPDGIQEAPTEGLLQQLAAGVALSR